MSIRVVAISDTHTYHQSVDLPHGDILIHAGDFTFRGREEEVRDFGEWIRSQPHQYKCVIAGNHDLSFERRNAEAVSWLGSAPGFHYLQDSEVVLNVGGRDIKVYGSPWQPEFHNWAFNLPRGKDLREKWDLIPGDTDILVTHGPPWSVLDKTDNWENVGCMDLYNAIASAKLSKLKLHVFGHIHESYGYIDIDNTRFVNASSCTLAYSPYNPAIVVDI